MTVTHEVEQAWIRYYVEQRRKDMELGCYHLVNANPVTKDNKRKTT